MSHASKTSELVEIGYRKAENGQIYECSANKSMFRLLYMYGIHNYFLHLNFLRQMVFLSILNCFIIQNINISYHLTCLWYAASDCNILQVMMVLYCRYNSFNFLRQVRAIWTLSQSRSYFFLQYTWRWMSHLSKTSELVEIGYRKAENGQIQSTHEFPKISILRLENSQNPFNHIKDQ